VADMDHYSQEEFKILILDMELGELGPDDLALLGDHFPHLTSHFSRVDRQTLISVAESL